MSFKRKQSIIVSSVFMLGTFISQNVYAQSKASAMSSSPKVCIINVQSAILRTYEGIEAKKRIESEVEKERQEILSKENQFNKLSSEFEEQRSLLPDSDKKAKEKELKIKYQELQQSQISFQQNARKKELTATQEIYQKMTVIVKKVRKVEKCNFAFDSGAGVLLDADDVTDITSKIIEKYNAENKAKAKG